MEGRLGVTCAYGGCTLCAVKYNRMPVLRPGYQERQAKIARRKARMEAIRAAKTPLAERFCKLVERTSR